MDPTTCSKQVKHTREDHEFWVNERKCHRCSVASLSGEGSCLETTEDIRCELPAILERFEITSVIDAPCGDFFWGRLIDYSSVTYQGYDILPDVISTLNKTFGGPTKQFSLLDVVEESIPSAADLIICRDFLFHLSSGNVMKVIANFNQSKSKYLLTTYFPSLEENPLLTEKQLYGYSPLNLLLPPYSWVPPLYEFAEKHPKNNGRSLGLWKLPIAKRQRRLLHYAGPSGDFGHVKNQEGMQLMCAEVDYMYLRSTDIKEVLKQDYDILWSPIVWIEPVLLPKVFIMFGPQFSTFPHPTLHSEEKIHFHNAVYNVLSDWNRLVYEKGIDLRHQFKLPLVTWPFAVNLERFAPTQKVPRQASRCLVYFKHRKTSDLEFVLQHLACRPELKVKVIEYGSYKEVDYLRALQHETDFVVWLDGHESQGFALQECLATDIPVLVLDAHSMFDEVTGGTHPSFKPCDFQGQELRATSTSLWDERCGEKCTDLSQFPVALDHFLKTLVSSSYPYAPCAFVKEHLSPAVCMNRIVKTFDQWELRQKLAKTS